MSFFRKELARLQQYHPKGRRWIFVPYDQITDRVGPLSRENPKNLGIVLAESYWKAARRPYHKQKLAFILSNLRSFALEQARRGVAVKHIVTMGPYRAALEPLIAEVGPLRVMEPAERELRQDLDPLIKAKMLEIIPHEGWLTKESQFSLASGEKPPWRMESFHRFLRKETGILMRSGKYEGGKLSLDAENRQAWKGKPPAPNPLSFPRDPVKEEVGFLISKHFSHHPGKLDLDHLPSTQEEAEKQWQWAKSKCLPFFGPFEDAMSTRSQGLFHTRISPLLNIHRLLPSKVVSESEHLPIPLASKEGFIRQVLGWREFVRHIHSATDGFRNLPDGKPVTAPSPGDGGFSLWYGKPWKSIKTKGNPDGGANPSFLGGKAPLPPVYWGEKSGLACLDHVVANVWAEGYSHHITRLMVLSNFASLLDVSPREVTDWFWVAYIDAYDWVVEPNVLGMGTYALGDLMTTKPYVSGAAYINKMSNYCRGCAFDPRKNCPVTNLYWAFLCRHHKILMGNPRLRVPLAALGSRGLARIQKDQKVFVLLQKMLIDGEKVSPRNFRED